MPCSINREKSRLTFSADMKGTASDAHMGTLENLLSRFSSHTEILGYMLDCVAKVEGGGAENVTLSYIDSVVKSQMELNKTTQKTIQVGSGKGAASVKYEQRAVTPKWIMEKTLSDKNTGIDGARAVNQDAANEYIKLHHEVLQHNQWLCTSNNIEPTEENIRNFNRRTGKAATRAAKEGA